MPYLLGLTLVMCALLACPQRAASDDGRDTSASGISSGVSKRTRQQWDPNAYEPSSEWSGPKYVSGSDDLGPQGREYRNGVIISGVVTALGAAVIAGGMVAIGNNARDPEPSSIIPVGGYTCVALGAVMTTGGLIGMAIAGSKLRDHKRRRAQWDFEEAAWVF